MMNRDPTMSSLSDIDEVAPKPSDIEVFAGNSTFHGINHVFTNGRCSIRRILWGLAFLTSFGLLVNQGVDRVLYFFQYPHVTKLDELEAQMMSFPAITICNLNPFRFSQITKNDLYHMGHAFEMLKPDKTLAHSNYIDPEHLRTLKMLSDFDNNFTPTKSFSMKEFYDRAGIQIDEMSFSMKEFYDRAGIQIDEMSFSMKEFCDRAGIQIDEMSFSMTEFYDRAGIQIDEMLLKSFSMTEFYDRAGIQIDEMLLKCSYRGEDNCGPRNFSTCDISG
ncbi:acid-sensing ion channel 1C-like [Branchiostoma floridae x Branchiostoma belcheri]